MQDPGNNTTQKNTATNPPTNPKGYISFVDAYNFNLEKGQPNLANIWQQEKNSGATVYFPSQESIKKEYPSLTETQLGNIVNAYNVYKAHAFNEQMTSLDSGVYSDTPQGRSLAKKTGGSVFDESPEEKQTFLTRGNEGKTPALGSFAEYKYKTPGQVAEDKKFIQDKNGKFLPISNLSGTSYNHFQYVDDPELGYIWKELPDDAEADANKIRSMYGPTSIHSSALGAIGRGFVEGLISKTVGGTGTFLDMLSEKFDPGQKTMFTEAGTKLSNIGKYMSQTNEDETAGLKSFIHETSDGIGMFVGLLAASYMTGGGASVLGLARIAPKLAQTASIGLMAIQGADSAVKQMEQLGYTKAEQAKWYFPYFAGTFATMYAINPLTARLWGASAKKALEEGIKKTVIEGGEENWIEKSLVNMGDEIPKKKTIVTSMTDALKSGLNKVRGQGKTVTGNMARSSVDMGFVSVANGTYDAGLQLLQNSAAYGNALTTKNKYDGSIWTQEQDGKFYVTKNAIKKELPYGEWKNQQDDYALALETLEGRGKIYQNVGEGIFSATGLGSMMLSNAIFMGVGGWIAPEMFGSKAKGSNPMEDGKTRFLQQQALKEMKDPSSEQMFKDTWDRLDKQGHIGISNEHDVQGNIIPEIDKGKTVTARQATFQSIRSQIDMYKDIMNSTGWSKEKFMLATAYDKGLDVEYMSYIHDIKELSEVQRKLSVLSDDKASPEDKEKSQLTKEEQTLISHKDNKDAPERQLSPDEINKRITDIQSKMSDITEPGYKSTVVTDDKGNTSVETDKEKTIFTNNKGEQQQAIRSRRYTERMDEIMHINHIIDTRARENTLNKLGVKEGEDYDQNKYDDIYEKEKNKLLKSDDVFAEFAIESFLKDKTNADNFHNKFKLVTDGVKKAMQYELDRMNEEIDTRNANAKKNIQNTIPDIDSASNDISALSTAISKAIKDIASGGNIEAIQGELNKNGFTINNINTIDKTIKGLLSSLNDLTPDEVNAQRELPRIIKLGKSIDELKTNLKGLSQDATADEGADMLQARPILETLQHPNEAKGTERPSLENIETNNPEELSQLRRKGIQTLVNWMPVGKYPFGSYLESVENQVANTQGEVEGGAAITKNLLGAKEWLKNLENYINANHDYYQNYLEKDDKLKEHSALLGKDNDKARMTKEDKDDTKQFINKTLGRIDALLGNDKLKGIARKQIDFNTTVAKLTVRKLVFDDLHELYTNAPTEKSKAVKTIIDDYRNQINAIIENANKLYPNLKIDDSQSQGMMQMEGVYIDPLIPEIQKNFLNSTLNKIEALQYQTDTKLGEHIQYAVENVCSNPKYAYDGLHDFTMMLPNEIKGNDRHAGAYSYQSYVQGREDFINNKPSESQEHEAYRFLYTNAIHDIYLAAKGGHNMMEFLNAFRDAAITYNDVVKTTRDDENGMDGNIAYAARNSHRRTVVNMLSFMFSPDSKDLSHSEDNKIWMNNVYQIRGGARTGKTTTLPAWFLMAYDKLKDSKEYNITVITPNDGLRKGWIDNLVDITKYFNKQDKKLNIEFRSYKQVLEDGKIDAFTKGSDTIFIDELTLLKTGAIEKFKPGIEEYKKAVFVIGDDNQTPPENSGEKYLSSISGIGKKSEPFTEILSTGVGQFFALDNNIMNMARTNAQGKDMFFFGNSTVHSDADGNGAGIKYYGDKKSLIDGFLNHMTKRNGTEDPDQTIIVVPSLKERDKLIATFPELEPYKDNVKVLFYDDKQAGLSEEYNISGLDAKNVFVGWDPYKGDADSYLSITGLREGETDAQGFGNAKYVSKLLNTAVSRRREYVAIIDSKGDNIKNNVEEKDRTKIISPPTDKTDANDEARTDLIKTMNEIAGPSTEKAKAKTSKPTYTASTNQRGFTDDTTNVKALVDSDEVKAAKQEWKESSPAKAQSATTILSKELNLTGDSVEKSRKGMLRKLMDWWLSRGSENEQTLHDVYDTSMKDYIKKWNEENPDRLITNENDSYQKYYSKIVDVFPSSFKREKGSEDLLVFNPNIKTSVGKGKAKKIFSGHPNVLRIVGMTNEGKPIVDIIDMSYTNSTNFDNYENPKIGLYAAILANEGVKVNKAYVMKLKEYWEGEEGSKTIKSIGEREGESFIDVTADLDKHIEKANDLLGIKKANEPFVTREEYFMNERDNSSAVPSAKIGDYVTDADGNDYTIQNITTRNNVRDDKPNFDNYVYLKGKNDVEGKAYTEEEFSKFQHVDKQPINVFKESGKQYVDGGRTISLGNVVEEQSYAFFGEDPTNPNSKGNKHLLARSIVKNNLTKTMHADRVLAETTDEQGNKTSLKLFDKKSTSFKVFPDAIVHVLDDKDCKDIFDNNKTELEMLGVKSLDDFYTAGLHLIGFEGEPEFDYKVDNTLQHWNSDAVQKRMSPEQLAAYETLSIPNAWGKDMLTNKANTGKIKELLNTIFDKAFDKIPDGMTEDLYKAENIRVNKTRLLQLIALRNGVENMGGTLDEIMQGRANREKSSIPFNDLVSKVGEKGFGLKSQINLEGESPDVKFEKNQKGYWNAIATFNNDGLTGKPVNITANARVIKNSDIESFREQLKNGEINDVEELIRSNTSNILKNYKDWVTSNNILHIRSKGGKDYIEEVGKLPSTKIKNLDTVLTWIETAQRKGGEIYMPMFAGKNFIPENATTFFHDIEDPYTFISNSRDIVNFFNEALPEDENWFGDGGAHGMYKVNEGGFYGVESHAALKSEVDRLIGIADPERTMLEFTPGLNDNGLALFGQLDGHIMRFNDLNGWVHNTVGRHESMHFIINRLVKGENREKIISQAKDDMIRQGIATDRNAITRVQALEHISNIFETKEYLNRKMPLLTRVMLSIERFTGLWSMNRSKLMNTLYASDRGEFRNASVVGDPEGGMFAKIDNKYTNPEEIKRLVGIFGSMEELNDISQRYVAVKLQDFLRYGNSFTDRRLTDKEVYTKLSQRIKEEYDYSTKFDDTANLTYKTDNDNGEQTTETKKVSLKDLSQQDYTLAKQNIKLNKENRRIIGSYIRKQLSDSDTLFSIIQRIDYDRNIQNIMEHDAKYQVANNKMFSSKENEYENPDDLFSVRLKQALGMIPLYEIHTAEDGVKYWQPTNNFIASQSLHKDLIKTFQEMKSAGKQGWDTVFSSMKERAGKIRSDKAMMKSRYESFLSEIGDENTPSNIKVDNNGLLTGVGHYYFINNADKMLGYYMDWWKGNNSEASTEDIANETERANKEIILPMVKDKQRFLSGIYSHYNSLAARNPSSFAMSDQSVKMSTDTQLDINRIAYRTKTTISRLLFDQDTGYSTTYAKGLLQGEKAKYQINNEGLSYRDAEGNMKPLYDRKNRKIVSPINEDALKNVLATAMVDLGIHKLKQSPHLIESFKENNYDKTGRDVYQMMLSLQAHMDVEKYVNENREENKDLLENKTIKTDNLKTLQDEFYKGNKNFIMTADKLSDKWTKDSINQNIGGVSLSPMDNYSFIQGQLAERINEEDNESIASKQMTADGTIRYGYPTSSNAHDLFPVSFVKGTDTSMMRALNIKGGLNELLKIPGAISNGTSPLYSVKDGKLSFNNMFLNEHGGFDGISVFEEVTTDDGEDGIAFKQAVSHDIFKALFLGTMNAGLGSSDYQKIPCLFHALGESGAVPLVHFFAKNKSRKAINMMINIETHYNKQVGGRVISNMDFNYEHFATNLNKDINEYYGKIKDVSLARWDKVVPGATEEKINDYLSKVKPGELDKLHDLRKNIDYKKNKDGSYSIGRFTEAESCIRKGTTETELYNSFNEARNGKTLSPYESFCDKMRQSGFVLPTYATELFRDYKVNIEEPNAFEKQYNGRKVVDVRKAFWKTWRDVNESEYSDKVVRNAALVEWFKTRPKYDDMMEKVAQKMSDDNYVIKNDDGTISMHPLIATQFYTSYAVDESLSHLLLGNPLMYENEIDYVKRGKMLVSPGITFDVDNPWSYMKSHSRVMTWDDIKYKNKLFGDKEGNYTDGTSFMLPWFTNAMRYDQGGGDSSIQGGTQKTKLFDYDYNNDELYAYKMNQVPIDRHNYQQGTKYIRTMFKMSLPTELYDEFKDDIENGSQKQWDSAMEEITERLHDNPELKARSIDYHIFGSCSKSGTTKLNMIPTKEDYQETGDVNNYFDNIDHDKLMTMATDDNVRLTPNRFFRLQQINSSDLTDPQTPVPSQLLAYLGVPGDRNFTSNRNSAQEVDKSRAVITNRYTDKVKELLNKPNDTKEQKELIVQGIIKTIKDEGLRSALSPNVDNKFIEMLNSNVSPDVWRRRVYSIAIGKLNDSLKPTMTGKSHIIAASFHDIYSKDGQTFMRSDAIKNKWINPVDDSIIVPGVTRQLPKALGYQLEGNDIDDPNAILITKQGKDVGLKVSYRKQETVGPFLERKTFGIAPDMTMAEAFKLRVNNQDVYLHQLNDTQLMKKLNGYSDAELKAAVNNLSAEQIDAIEKLDTDSPKHITKEMLFNYYSNMNKALDHILMRLPTLGISSGAYSHLVGFGNDNDNTAYINSEANDLTDADFDGDMMNVLTRTFDKNGNINSKDPRNELFESMVGHYEDTRNAKLVLKNIDLQKLRDKVDEIEQTNKPTRYPSEIGTSVIMQRQNFGGERVISHFANLQMVMSTLFHLDDGILNKIGMSERLLDQDDTKYRDDVFEWITTLTHAATVNEKEGSLLARLNINEHTSSLIAGMMYLGLEKFTQLEGSKGVFDNMINILNTPEVLKAVKDVENNRRIEHKWESSKRLIDFIKDKKLKEAVAKGEALRELADILSIQQEVKQTPYDIYKTIDNFERYAGVSLKDFVTNEDVIKKIKDGKYEPADRSMYLKDKLGKVKPSALVVLEALNIPLIVKNLAHTDAMIGALYYTNDEIKRTNTIDSNPQLDEAFVKNTNRRQFYTMNEHKSYEEGKQQYVIQQFLNDKGEILKTPLGDYNMKSQQQREQLYLAMPNIIQGYQAEGSPLADNEFIKAMKEKDRNSVFANMEFNNSIYLTKEQKSIIRQDFNNLPEDVKQIFRYYHMMTQGFVYRNGSFSEMMDIDLETKYSKWVKEFDMTKHNTDAISQEVAVKQNLDNRVRVQRDSLTQQVVQPDKSKLPEVYNYGGVHHIGKMENNDVTNPYPKNMNSYGRYVGEEGIDNNTGLVRGPNIDVNYDELKSLNNDEVVTKVIPKNKLNDFKEYKGKYPTSWGNGRMVYLSDGSEARMFRNGDESYVSLTKNEITNTRFNEKYGDNAFEDFGDAIKDVRKNKIVNKMLNDKKYTDMKLRAEYNIGMENLKINYESKPVDFKEWLKAKVEQLKCL